jgi:transcriptional regulator with XRE-family HTH domain
MAKIREILAANIKEYRRKRGITQSELAERSNISANFMGMIEQERKFPAPEVLDRIAEALGIDTSELFITDVSPQAELKKLHKAILAGLNQAIGDAVDKAIANKYQSER